MSKGHPHTEDSRAKISAANKGKTPWNIGKQHSEETKRKIAETTRLAVLKKKTEEAAALGLTLEELEEKKKQERIKKRRAKMKGGLTDEGRKRISDSMKRRWGQPGYREWYAENVRGKRNHSNETRAIISEKIKAKWTEEEYRTTAKKRGQSEEVRAKISATLKARWQDPEFRNKMKNASNFERTPEWKAQISEKIKAKWNDPDYRKNVVSSIRSSYNSSTRIPRAPRVAKVKTVQQRNPQEEALRRAKILAQKRQKEKERIEALNAAKLAATKSDPATRLKEILGGELWFEEKLKRRKDGEMFKDDESLEKELLEEWKDHTFDEEDQLYLEDIIASKAKKDKIPPSKLKQAEKLLEEYDDYEDEDDEDLIEVYDEVGELVGHYSLSEYQAMKNKLKQQ